MDVLFRIKVIRYVNYGKLNGLVVVNKNYPKKEIVDEIEIFEGSFPKKYKATIKTITPNIPEQFVINKKYSFGSQLHEQYHDKIGLYKDLDHNDEQRKKRFYERFRSKIIYPSSTWLSATLLW